MSGTSIHHELSAEELERRRRTRVIKRVTSREDQDDEALEYWMSRAPDESVEVAWEITNWAFSSKEELAGYQAGSNRTLTRVQRERR